MSLRRVTIAKPLTSAVYIFLQGSTGPYYRRFADVKLDDGPEHDALADLIQIPAHSGSGPTGHSMLAYQRRKNNRAYYTYKYSESGNELVGSATFRALPRVNAPLNVPLHLSPTDLQQRRLQIINAFALNADATASVLQYLREAYYFVPIHLALGLQSAGHRLASLDCFRTVYDYESPIGATNKRNIYYGLELDAKMPDVPLYQQADGWLLDPLNPHSIAATRHYTYTRFTLMSIVRCLLDFADSELIGTIRRECLDWLLPLSEPHLRTILRSWSDHYNRGRPHMSLGPGVPGPPRNLMPASDAGYRHRVDAAYSVAVMPVRGGLHHEYNLQSA